MPVSLSNTWTALREAQREIAELKAELERLRAALAKAQANVQTTHSPT